MLTFMKVLDEILIHRLLLENFLRCVRTLCMALRTASHSPVHSNAIINYVIAIRL